VAFKLSLIKLGNVNRLGISAITFGDKKLKITKAKIFVFIFSYGFFESNFIIYGKITTHFFPHYQM